MEKSFIVYFKNGTDTVYMGKERKKAFATLDINKALEFTSLEDAKIFIKKLKKLSTGYCPNFYILDFVNL